MIQKLEISGVHMEVGDDLKKHVMKKIGRLDKYVSKHARASAHAEVRLKEAKANKANKGTGHTCEAVLYLPQEVLTVNATADSIFAAVDAAEEKLKMQLHKYKDKHAGPKLHQRLLAKLKRNGSL